MGMTPVITIQLKINKKYPTEEDVDGIENFTTGRAQLIRTRLIRSSTNSKGI